MVPIVAAGRAQQAPPATGANTARFSSLGSNRYAYWRVAIDTGATTRWPGVGAGGFRVEWLRRRHIDEAVRDAHSLELETFAELGLVGLALLAGCWAAPCCRAGAALADPAAAAGPAAALTRGSARAIDWDWEMPALTLVAVVLAGALRGRRGRQSSSAIRGASRLNTHAASTQIPT